MKKILTTLAAAAALVSSTAFARHATTTTTAATTPAATTAATAPAATTPATTTAAPATAATTATPAPGKIVHVNSATAAELTTIPGINAKIAADVIKNRPYKNSAELVKKVKGIGPKNVKKMLPYIDFQ